MQQNFMEIFSGPEDTQWAKEIPQGRPEVGTTHQGAPGPPGAPRWVVLPSEPPSGTYLAKQVSFGPKKYPKSFAAFGLRLVLIFCEVKKSKKQQPALGTMSIG